MHLSSLPGTQGIGTMGREARAFVDFLVRAGQRYWQVLPTCPTGYGDSPYQSFSTFAGNPYFIDLALLAEDGLLEKRDYDAIDWQSTPEDINYGSLYEKKYPVLHQAVRRFLRRPDPGFQAFCAREAGWLTDYALFMALKDACGGLPWWQWPEPLRNRRPDVLRTAGETYRREVEFWMAVQYLFHRQWRSLKAYANARGIALIGDLPIYVSRDSVDVWARPELFQLDGNRIPREVAGCPPDGFSASGQLWGNPLFDWDYLRRTGYAWWVQRIERLCGMYDRLRIDHFRGFEAYYAIPFGAGSARDGRWRPGPGIDLFRAVERALGPVPIIAEDLGFLTDGVRRLLRESGYPGMKVLEFAFDSRDGGGEEYLPQNYPVHCVAYTGTHDNEPIQGWLATAPAADVARARQVLGLGDPACAHWDMMRSLWESPAELTVVQTQDLLGLGSESRMNTPSTVGGNWRWRVRPDALTPELADRIRQEMHRCGRCTAAQQPDGK